MVAWNIVFMVLGLVALLESLIILLFPDKSINIMKKWLKEKSLKRAGLIELIIALILILIGMNI